MVMVRFNTRILLLLSLPAWAGCGGSQPSPQAPTTVQSEEDDEDSLSGIGATAEIGAMPEDETVAAFRGAFGPIQKCFVAGAGRIEYLGGQISLQVRVGQNGKVQGVFAERSTLGDRATERCMFQALEAADWPEPVGGLTGIAQNSFEFEMTGDVRAPVDIEGFDASQALSEHSEAIGACKSGNRAKYEATVYIDTDGSVLAAGIASPSVEAESASDCLVEVLQRVTFPSPGSWPGKVSFTF